MRNELTEEHLNPILLASHRRHTRRRAHSARRDYRELYDKFDYRLDDLAEQCRAFLDSTEALYEDAADRLLRAASASVSTERAALGRRARLPRDEWDSRLPGDRMLPALEATLADLGVDLRAQENVHLDVEERPNKSPRAFCAPIEVPGKVMLVIQPIGGPDDWRALFHEAGHAEHFANTRAELTVEERRLGDSAVTEGWAMLLEHLIDDPVWLARRLDFPRPAEFAAEGAAQLLFFVRRYCAKLLYELEFHATDDVTSMQPRYVELLGDALKIEPSPTDYLADIDPASTSRRTCARGRSRRSCARTCARSSATRGSRGARPARSCASSGAKASAGPPRTSSRHHRLDARARVGRGARARASRSGLSSITPANTRFPA